MTLHSNLRPLLLRTAACSLLLAAGAATATDSIEVFTSGAHFYKRAVTNTNPLTTSSTAFVALPGATTVVTVPPQSAVLVNVDFTAETRCSGGGANPNWCETAILIGGVEGSPQASSFGPDTFAMDSTDNGQESGRSWEAHAMSRHRCVTNNTNQPMPLPVSVQWKVTNFGAAGGALPPEFWVDDSSLVVQLARGCENYVLPSPQDPGAPGNPNDPQR